MLQKKTLESDGYDAIQTKLKLEEVKRQIPTLKDMLKNLVEQLKMNGLNLYNNDSLIHNLF